ncbi:hypothetical protein EDB83DRAFT_2336973 [Lactarius deliciosus]|nr:hypothetical protein EDB83DRAFT_2336973 [Lactarius deliciosus]
MLHISPISLLRRSLTYHLKVDTKADPPRAIWTHPYEDEQYLREHPEVREKVGNLTQQQDSKDPSGSKPSRRHSFNGRDSNSMVSDEHPTSPDASQKGKEKRGFFGKLKDKAIGTKEEREAYKKEQARVRLLDVAFLYKFLTDQSRLDRERETAPACRANSRTASAVCTGAGSFRATASYV